MSCWQAVSREKLGFSPFIGQMNPWEKSLLLPERRRTRTPHNAIVVLRILVIGWRPVSKSLWPGTPCFVAWHQESELPLRCSPLAVLGQSFGDHAPGPAGGRLNLEQVPEARRRLTNTQSSLKTWFLFVRSFSGPVQASPLELRISGRDVNPEGKCHVFVFE